jgi:adenylate cyclase
MQAGRYQESLDAFERIVRPHNDVNILVAASFAGLGQADKAQLAMRKFLDRQIPPRPGSNESVWSIEKEKRASCYRSRADLENYLGLLRIGGLPEN